MKKSTKIAIVACAAIVVLAGGFGVRKFVLNLGKTEQTIPNEIEEQTALNLSLTDQYDQPMAYGAQPEAYAAPDDYWFDSLPASGAPGGCYFTYYGGGLQNALYYADDASTEPIPLCAQPQCLHNGSIYCPATTSAYKHGQAIWHDGYLYATAVKTDTDECVVLRYEADGTGIKELCRLGKEYTPTHTIIAHRGYVFFMTRKTETSDQTYQDWVHSNGEARQMVNRGWALWCLDPNTGNAFKLTEAMPDEFNREQVIYGFSRLCGVGDALYFSFIKESVKCSWGDQGTYRLDLKTREIKRVSQDVALGFSGDGTEAGLYGYFYVTSGRCELRSIQTGEALSTDHEVGHAMTDGQHIFASYNDSHGKGAIYVFDMDGSTLQRYPMEMFRPNFYIRDGRLWTTRSQLVGQKNHTDVAISASLESLVAGTPDWRDEFFYPYVKDED